MELLPPSEKSKAQPCGSDPGPGCEKMRGQVIEGAGPGEQRQSVEIKPWGSAVPAGGRMWPTQVIYLEDGPSQAVA